MRYREILEAKLPDPREFGEVGPGPALYLHYTYTAAQVRSILANGFDLKKFGHTARKLNMGEFAVNDPRGVFATEYQDNGRFADRPYVVFKLPQGTRVLTKPGKHPGWSEDLKADLSRLYGASGAKFARILLGAGIQVLHSQAEFIILDPSLITVVAYSLAPGGAPTSVEAA